MKVLLVYLAIQDPLVPHYPIYGLDKPTDLEFDYTGDCSHFLGKSSQFDCHPKTLTGQGDGNVPKFSLEAGN